MDDFDDMMDSWGVNDGQAMDDIGAYVAARNEKRRVRDNRQRFAPPSKQYGYQEPKSVFKPKPRVVYCVDNGGWDSNTAGNIPKYQRWQDDPLRKKIVPGSTSPRDRQSPRSHPDGMQRSRSHQPPLSTRSGRAGNSARGSVNNRLPPIATNLAEDHPPQRARAASLTAAAPAAPVNHSHNDDDGHSAAAPVQHPYRGEAAKLPPLNRKTVQAYSAPTAARRKLPPLPGLRLKSGRGGDRPTPSTSPRKPRTAGESPRHLQHRDWAGEADRGGEDGGECATNRQRVADGEPLPSPRAAAPPKRTPEEELEIAVARLTAVLAEEKASVKALTLAKTMFEEQLLKTKDGTKQLKDDIAKSQQVQKALVTADKERNNVQAALRKKDRELKELRAMIAETSRRVDELTVTSVSVSGKHQPMSESAELENRLMLRDLAKQRSAVKQSIAALEEERQQLLDDLGRSAAAANDRQRRDALVQDRIARERKLTLDALKAKLAADLEQELIRMRENHAKALRHRERDLEVKAQQASQEAEAEHEKLGVVASGNGAITKTLAETKAAVASQRGILDELTRQMHATQARLDEVAAANSRKKNQVEELRKKAESLEMQKTLAESSPPHAAPSHGADKNAAERTQLRQKLDELAAKERRDVDTLTGLERELAEHKSDASRRKLLADAVEAEAQATHHAAATRKKELDANLKAAKQQLKAAQAASDTSAKDTQIEALTKQTAVAYSAKKAAERENVQQLEKLDQLERLLAMSSLH
jgi:hypothetical protein